MAHDHAQHDHSHGHHHGPVTNVSRTLLIGAALNLLYVAVEFGAGIYYGSMALVADAGHNLSDVASLLLSVLAFWLAKARSTATFTYGYRKSTVLASLGNAVLLLVTVGAIVWESIGRFQKPEPVVGGVIAWVAAAGILVNTGSALLFYRDKDHDLNIRGAYLHLAADAAVSLAVVVGGIMIRYTGWTWIDPALGVLVAVVILGATWRLLIDSVRLSLDGVPDTIDLADVQTRMGQVDGVQEVHHVHVWAMSTTETALTAHLIMQPGLSMTQTLATKNEVRHQLEHLGIQHATLEVEMGPDDCADAEC